MERGAFPVERVADDRARHAVAAPASATELRAHNGDEPTPALRNSEFVCVLRSFATDDAGLDGDQVDAGLDGDQVVAAVPLLAFAVVDRTSGFDDAEVVEVERARNDVGEDTRFLGDFDAAPHGPAAA